MQVKRREAKVPWFAWVIIVAGLLLAIAGYQSRRTEGNTSVPSWAVVQSKTYYPAGKVLINQIRKVDGINMEVWTERYASPAYSITATDSLGHEWIIDANWRIYTKYAVGDTIKVR